MGTAMLIYPVAGSAFILTDTYRYVSGINLLIINEFLFKDYCINYYIISFHRSELALFSRTLRNDSKIKGLLNVM